jgi:acetylcholinesterase
MSRGFTCSDLNIHIYNGKLQAEKPGRNNSVYVYSFNHRTSGNPWPAWTGAAHGYEIDHVFGLPLQAEYQAEYTDDERTLSSFIIAYWANFAKTG